jgi:hypothetical protein
MGFVFAHGGIGLPHHDAVMFLMPLLPALLVATIVIAAWLDRRGYLGAPGRMVSAYAPVAVIAAALSLAAAGIHFAVISDHLEWDVAAGVAMFGVGVFQAIWAQLYLLRESRRVAQVAALVNAMVVVTWVVSRTVGLPIGQTPWVPEAVGLADLLATSFEIGLIGLLLPRLLPERFAGWLSTELPAQKAFVLAGFTVITLVVLAGVALLPDAIEFLEF